VPSFFSAGTTSNTGFKLALRVTITPTLYRTGAVSDSVLDMAGGVLALALLWLTRRKPAGLDHHGSG
jgi:hypothetical protein